MCLAELKAGHGAPGMTLLVWGITPGAPELSNKHTELVKGTGAGATWPQFKSQVDHLVTGQVAYLVALRVR